MLDFGRHKDLCRSKERGTSPTNTRLEEAEEDGEGKEVEG